MVMKAGFSPVLGGKNWKVLICLYADVTILLADSEKDLQRVVSVERG